MTFRDFEENVIAKMWVEYGKSLNAIPAVPEIPGYYEAWGEIPESITCDVTIRPIYTPIEYTVTFYDSEGKEYGEPVKYTVVDRNIKIPEVPPRFENDIHYKRAWDIPELTYGDVDIYPVYTPIVYTVNFYAEGRLVYERTYTVENTSIIIPLVPEKEGYDQELVSWNQTDYNLNTLEKYLMNIRIDAVYDSYFIDVDSNGSPETVDRFHGSASSGFVTPDAISRTGYTFGGWQAENGTIYQAGKTVTEDLSKEDENQDSIFTLTAVWTANTYTVEYQVVYENGTVDTVKTHLATYDVEFNIHSYSRTGYIIPSEWNNSTYGSYVHGEKVKNLTPTDGAIVVFKINANRISYTINYYDRTGSKIGSNTVYYDTAYTTASHSETGYTFNYWKDENGNKLFNQSTTVIKNLTSTNKAIVRVYADMTILRYTITLSPGTGSTLTITVGNSSWTTSQTFDYGTIYTISVSEKGGYQNATCPQGTGTYTVTGPKTFTSSAELIPPPPDTGDDSCLAKGTLIMLSDGSFTEIENLPVGDTILTFDHATGRYLESQIAFTFYAYTEVKIISLQFSNGTNLDMANGGHGAFDTTLNQYVLITADNVSEFVGHNFSFVTFVEGQPVQSEVELISYNITVELIERYDIATANQLNHIAEGILACSDALVGFCNVFDFAEDITYDEEKMYSDIEKYGLFTYEEWSEYITYEEFVIFNGGYFKVAVEKGLVTEEEIFFLINELKTMWQ